MRNIALLYFKDICVLPEQNTKFHFIDTYESTERASLTRIHKDHGSNLTRVVWASLEMDEGCISEKVISSVLPYATRELKESIRTSMSRDIKQDSSINAEALFMAQRTIIGAICHADLTYYISQCLRFWRSYLNIVGIDYIISNVIPHSLSDYLLAIACRQLHIPFISQVPTGMSRHCWYLEMGSGQYIRSPVRPTNESIQDIHEFISATRGTSKSYSEAYSSDVNMAVNLWRKDYKSFLLSASESAIQVFNYKLNLTQYYDLASKIKPIPADYGQANILFLHYQPEATSSPLAKSFYDQRFIVDTVLSGMAENDILIIKEHPVQFFTSGIQESSTKHIQNCLGYRSISFYKYLEFFPSIYLCPRQISKQKLFGMRNIKVWSATGTVLLEAYVNNVDIGLLNTYSIYNLLGNCIEIPDEPRHETAARILGPYVWKKFSNHNLKSIFLDENVPNTMLNMLIKACPVLV